MLNLSLVNKLSDISFCDKQCSNVNDNEFKSKLINYIQDNLNVNIIDRIYVNMVNQSINYYHKRVIILIIFVKKIGILGKII